MGRRQQGHRPYLRLPHLRVIVVVSLPPLSPNPRVVQIVDEAGHVVREVDADVRRNRVLVLPQRRIFGVDGVIRGWSGGWRPTDMEYDATALKKLVGRRKATQVYTGRSICLTWAGETLTYDNTVYPVPAAMQPIKKRRSFPLLPDT